MLDLIKQNDFIVVIMWKILKNLKKNWLAKKSFITLSPVKKLVTKNMKTMKDYHNFHIKCCVLFLTDMLFIYAKNRYLKPFDSK